MRLTGSSLLLALALIVTTGCRRAAEPGRSAAGSGRAGATAPPRGTVVTLLYSSNLRGEYEPCG